MRLWVLFENTAIFEKITWMWSFDSLTLYWYYEEIITDERAKVWLINMSEFD